MEKNKEVRIVEISDNIQVAEETFRITFNCKPIADNATPGTFINVKIPNDESLILRRPFSLHDVHGDDVSFIYSVVGKGSKKLSETKPGSHLDILGPLGKGFQIMHANAYLIGGGCGTPPLYFLAKKLREKKIPVYSFLGFSTSDKVMLTDEFEKFSVQTCLATNDGSKGERGTIIDLLKNVNIDGVIYACGPVRFLSALKKFCNERGISAQVSLEERMGCGFGVCLGCAVKASGSGYKYVCKDGPVFSIDEVELQHINSKATDFNPYMFF